MVKNNKRDNPIWNMVCCASATHKNNVTRLQKVQEDYNALKGQIESGTFRGEDARVQPIEGAGSKRKEPDAASGGEASVWDSFATSFKADAGHFTPDPEVIRSLRQEWRPL